MAIQTQTFSFGSLAYGSATKSYVLELTVNEESISPGDNTSYISYTLKLISGSNNRFNLYHIGANVWLNGELAGSRDRYSTAQVSLGYNSSVELLSGTATICHNADGSCTMPVAFSIDMEDGAYVPGSQHASGYVMTLSYIPRKSGIGATDADIGAVSVIAVAKHAESFTHSIAYTFGNLSGFITANGEISGTETIFGATGIPFTLPESFYTQIPNATSAECTLTVRTYSGASLVGTDSCKFKATAARSAAHPLATAEMTDINETTAALTGDNKKMIRYFSTAHCEMQVTPRKSATASFASIGDMHQPLEIDAQGRVLRDIPAIEAEEVYFYTIDSRGYDYGIRMSTQLIPYIKLTGRVTTKWTDIIAGCAKLQFSGVYYAGSFGAAENSLHIQYRPVGQQDYIPVENITVEDGIYYAEALLTGLDYQREYSYEIEVWDALMQIEQTVLLRKGQPVFHWGAEDFRFCVPVGMNDKSIRHVHSVNGLACGSVAFDENVTAYLSVSDRSLMLFGLAGDNGAYALYLVMLDSPKVLSQCVKLSGTLDVHFSMEQEGMLKVQSPSGSSYGWYIKNSDYADLISQ